MRGLALATLASILAAHLGGCGAGTIRGSIGAVLGRDPDSGAVYVRDVTERPGGKEPEILPGDEIVMVEGVHVRDLTTKDLRRRLRGDSGTRVRLTVLRGPEVLRVELERTPLREAISAGELRIEE